MKEREICQRTVLVEGAMGKIEVCTCELVHLTIGPLTVRLDPHAFSSLAATMNLADERLRQGKQRNKLGAAAEQRHLRSV